MGREICKGILGAGSEKKKLGDMMDKWNSGTLEFTPKCSYDILWNQYRIMGEYESILEERARIEDILLTDEEEEPRFCYECKNFDGEKGKCHLPGTPDDPYYCGLANFWEVR